MQLDATVTGGPKKSFSLFADRCRSWISGSSCSCRTPKQRHRREIASGNCKGKSLSEQVRQYQQRDKDGNSAKRRTIESAVTKDKTRTGGADPVEEKTIWRNTLTTTDSGCFSGRLRLVLHHSVILASCNHRPPWRKEPRWRQRGRVDDSQGGDDDDEAASDNT